MKFFNTFKAQVFQVIAFYILCAGGIVIGMLSLLNPIAVYSHVHFAWLWVIGGVLLVTAIFRSFMWSHLGFHAMVGAIHLLAGIVVFILILFGILFAPMTTYVLTKPQDFYVLSNLPVGQTYTVELQSDIDFQGFRAPKTFGSENIVCNFNGNGFAIVNLHYEAQLTEATTVFLDTNHVENVKFMNCEFHLTPKAYNSSREGEVCAFELVDRPTELSGGEYSHTVSGIITENVKIYVYQLEKGDRYVSAPTFGGFYPNGETGNGCSVDITVVTKEAEA